MIANDPQPQAWRTRMQTNPSVVAREALRQLASLRLPPTPENYARVYNHIAAPGVRPAPAGAVAMLRELADDLQRGVDDPADEAAALRRAVDRGDWLHAKCVLRSLCTTLRDTVADDIVAHGDVRAGEVGRDMALAAHARTSTLCRELLAEAVAVVSEEYGEDVAGQAGALAGEIRRAHDPAEIANVAIKLRAFWTLLSAASNEQREIQHGLLRLLELLTANVSELVGDASWMRGQLKAFTALSAGPLTIDTIAGLERGLREIAQRQGALKASLDEAKDAMKQMVATFIERVSELAANTGDYQERLGDYARAIEKARDIGELSVLVKHVMEDTRGLQGDLGKSRDELLAARRTVEEFQERAARLESELVVLSDRLQEDQLTQVLNRRGLERAFENESARADRYHRPLCVAMLDVDNFKALNDRFGHQAGDSALVHLTNSIRQSLRTTDIIARYGGEEFVVLLPETARDDALAVMNRVQRELARRYFVHDNERVLITFSGGVAERFPGEPQVEVIARADRALYDAKQQGKNRVLAA